jgi:hypothetical protein
MENITLFTITILKKGDASIAVGIVFNRHNSRWDTALVAAKVNNPVEAFVTTTPMASGNYTSVVAAFSAVN